MDRSRSPDLEKDPERDRFLPIVPGGGANQTYNGHHENVSVAVAPKAPLDLPPGMGILRRVIAPLRNAPIGFYQLYILIITYLLYVCYHISRKPLSVVKNRLHGNCSLLDAHVQPPNMTVDSPDYTTWCHWVPFEKDNYKELYSTLDFAYLMSYAIAMFFVGAVAERTNLRYFLTIGMLLAGFLTVLFGLAYTWEIHHFSFFLGVQIIGGALQATGFPCVVAIVGNWFGKARRGLVFGFWNSHASFGNILGSILASVWVNGNWGLSFTVPGLVIIIGGVVAYLFIIVRAEDAGFPKQNVAAPAPVEEGKNGAHELKDFSKETQQVTLVPAADDVPIKFWQAVMIPGVIEYATCMFFAKGVAYTFLVWLPVYIRNLETLVIDNKSAGFLSTAFDLGGIAGGIVVGAVSDISGARGMISGGLMFLAVPIMLALLQWGGHSLAVLIVLLIVTGFITVGPYSIIATAVSADLGTSLKGKSKALAAVSGIINGMGSFGAAFGPLFAGLISARWGWSAVFYFLASAQLVASLCLSRIIFREIARLRRPHTATV